MDQKMQFVRLAATGRSSVSQLCEDFDISWNTGHQWLSRHAAKGVKSLGEWSCDLPVASAKRPSRYFGQRGISANGIILLFINF